MIGVYGGTFDPVHFGHLRTALEVKEIFGLDELRLIPCSQPPHREAPLTLPEMRFEMLSLAVKNKSGLLVDRRELNREGYSYMIDTLKSLRNELFDSPIILFMGTDAFKYITSWHKWQQLFDYVHIVVISRPNYQHQLNSEFLSSRLTENRADLKKSKSGGLFFQPVTQLDISATTIRSIIRMGLNPAFLLPESVIEYIKQNKLYSE